MYIRRNVKILGTRTYSTNKYRDKSVSTVCVDYKNNQGSYGTIQGLKTPSLSLSSRSVKSRSITAPSWNLSLTPIGIFFNKTTDGSPVTYLQIAENIWDSQKKRSRVRVVCTLGRADERAIDRLRQLVRSIRRQSPEYTAEVEGWKFQNSWEHGGFHVIGRLWESLGIRELMEKAAREEDRTVPLERAVFVMVANRCLAPRSKLSCYERWMAEDIYFPEGAGIELHHLYRAMDFVADHKTAIEEQLYWRLADLLWMDVELIFYDTTSIYFEVDREDEGARRRGYSKDNRSDSPQEVVGMAVTRDGYPVKSWVFPGNRADVTTIEEVLGELEEELGSLRSHPKRACQLLSSRRYGQYLRTLRNGELRVSKKAIREKEKRDGLWVIHTNDHELCAEDLALAYKQLVRVEETWKTMKSTIETRPVFHRTEERIKAHVFLCVLALLVERVAERACGWTWPRIREELRSIKVAQLLTPNGMVYQTTSGSQDARNLLKKLKIKPLPEVLGVG